VFVFNSDISIWTSLIRTSRSGHKRSFVGIGYKVDNPVGLFLGIGDKGDNPVGLNLSVVIPFLSRDFPNYQKTCGFPVYTRR
jgi:hypothetical protein